MRPGVTQKTAKLKKNRMTKDQKPVLLPPGLADTLPPDAAFADAIRQRLIEHFAAYGYDRVTPPLVEFESGLLAGPGVAVAGQVFRLMDPISGCMMGLRADMTPQIARIAATRLGAQPRPLRLCYAGRVLRTAGTQLRPEREFIQVGAEIIGGSSPGSDAEMIDMAVEALEELGIDGLSVDLMMPALMPALLDGLDLSASDRSDLRLATERKDVEAVGDVLARTHPEIGIIVTRLIEAGGPAARALEQIAAIDLPLTAGRYRDMLADVIKRLWAVRPDLVLTVDAVEHRGMEYHTGVGFTLFGRHARGELGSGGRYAVAADPASGSGSKTASPQSESATGVTLFMDTIMRLLARPEPEPRLYVPAEPLMVADSRRWRAEGWITVHGLDPVVDMWQEARRLACSHVLRDCRPQAVAD